MSPHEEVGRIAKWLGADIHPQLSIALAKERVPREMPAENRREKMHKMELELSPENIALLREASGLYEQRLQLEPTFPVV